MKTKIILTRNSATGHSKQTETVTAFPKSAKSPAARILLWEKLSNDELKCEYTELKKKIISHPTY